MQKGTNIKNGPSNNNKKKIDIYLYRKLNWFVEIKLFRRSAPSGHVLILMKRQGSREPKYEPISSCIPREEGARSVFYLFFLLVYYGLSIFTLSPRAIVDFFPFFFTKNLYFSFSLQLETVAPNQRTRNFNFQYSIFTIPFTYR